MRPGARNRSLRTAAAAAGLGLLLGACFNPPAAAVQFTCEPAGEGLCPPDYACEDDGCCHRAGSDIDAHWGECRLGGDTGGATYGTTSGTTGGMTTGGMTTGGLTTGGTGDASAGTTTGSTGAPGTSGDASSTGDTGTGPQTTG